MAKAIEKKAKKGRRIFGGLGGLGVLAGAGLLVMAGCSPTVKVEAPDEPIEINLNIKIEQDVRIRMDKDVESLISDNPDIFD